MNCFKTTLSYLQLSVTEKSSLDGYTVNNITKQNRIHQVIREPTHILDNTSTTEKVSKYGAISGLHFPTFGLNTERYEVSVRIQSECGKIRTRNSSVFGHFSRSALPVLILYLLPSLT